MILRLPRPNFMFLACFGYLFIVFLLTCITIFSLTFNTPPSYPDLSHVEPVYSVQQLGEPYKSANSSSLVRACSSSSCRKYCTFSQTYRVDYFLSSGWTKSVFQVTLSDGTRAALKVVHTDGEDMNQCLKILSGLQHSSSFSKCLTRSAKKLYSEIRLLQDLEHPSISKVLAYCTYGCEACEQFPGSVALVTQLGKSVSNLILLQMPLVRRLQLAHDLAELLKYLSERSLLMLDLRLRQFVLVNEKLVLSDVDDVSQTERKCQNNTDCHSHSIVSVACEEGVCKGLTDRLNVYNAGQEFASYLLIGIGVEGDDLRRAYGAGELSPTILQRTKTLLNHFSAITKA